MELKKKKKNRAYYIFNIIYSIVTSVITREADIN